MDLRNPADLTNIIEAIFIAACREFDIRPLPTSEVIEPLVAPGRTYLKLDLQEVDLNKLHQAVSAVALSMINDSLGSVREIQMNRSSVSRALQRSTCHYLWFC